MAVREDDGRRASVVAGPHVSRIDWFKQVWIQMVEFGDEVSVGGKGDGEFQVVEDREVWPELGSIV